MQRIQLRFVFPYTTHKIPTVLLHCKHFEQYFHVRPELDSISSSATTDFHHFHYQSLIPISLISRYAAIYLCAGIENLLEEILLQCLPSDSDVNLTATLLEHAIANNGDLWGLLQPYAHLNAGRIASGMLQNCALLLQQV